MRDYSTKQISNKLIQEVIEALQNIRGWGSVEIQVQDFKVVQITERNIKKTVGKEATTYVSKFGS
jgi:hypothetical protein